MLPAPASPYLLVTADSLDAVGLDYVGTFDVFGSTGVTNVLRFTMTTGALTGTKFAAGCVGGVSIVTGSASASLVGTTFDALFLAMTVGGTLLVFTPTDPPTSRFPADVVVQDVALRVTTLTADTISMPSFTTESAAC